MTELVVPHEAFANLSASLLAQPEESCAVLFASETTRTDGTTRLLVRESRLADEADYLRRTSVSAELRPAFVAEVTKRARLTKTALVFVHTHPGTARPDFSPTDDLGEARLAAFLAHRHPASHVALVLSAGGVSSRRLGGTEEVRVLALGANREVLFEPASQSFDANDVYERQVRAFGATGQHRLQALRVAIVGLGGTGSIVAQQLAHLGVRDFLLIDADTVEPTNLNRVAGAYASDAGDKKVEVAARHIQSIKENAKVARLAGDVTYTRVARQLTDADVIFGCTDSHGSRAVIQQVAYQYLIPCIDMGVTIAAAAGVVSHIYGRVQLLAPGFGCLTCSSLLDSNEVRRDMMNAFERKADPYIVGVREPAPAVMSLNATVASLAVTMFLSLAVGIPSNGRYLLYNARTPALRSVVSPPASNCYVCSPTGSLARGDEWPLFGRAD